MSRFDERDASNEHARINKMKNDAMNMIQDMPPAAFEAWYTIAFPAMNEAATAAYVEAFEREADAHGETEIHRFQFAAATRGHEEPAW